MEMSSLTIPQSPALRGGENDAADSGYSGEFGECGNPAEGRYEEEDAFYDEESGVKRLFGEDSASDEGEIFMSAGEEEFLTGRGRRQGPDDSGEFAAAVEKWFRANIRKDASLTVERVLAGSAAGSGGLVWQDGREPETKEEVFYHISRKQHFSEICVSLAGWELEKNLKGLPRDEAEWLLAGELGKAGLLAGKVSYGEKRQEKKVRKPLTADDYRELLAENRRELFDKLRTLRREIAESKSLAQYIIFGNRSLAAMCTKLPETMEELRELPGVGPKNSSMYGGQFLEVIREFREKEPISSRDS